MRVDPDVTASHAGRNRLQTALLLGALALVLGILAWLLLGKYGVLGVLVLVAVMYAVAPKVSPKVVLRMYRGVELERRQAPALFDITERLSGRAGLEHTPKLYYLPSDVLNAFTVGRRDDAVIAVSDGLLRRMEIRELAAILAHEVAHVEHGDTRLMGFADMLARVTGSLASLGQLLLWINIPMALLGQAPIPWIYVIVLLLTPGLSTLTQLALSRTREFEADRRGAELMGDPRPLASALKKLEKAHSGWLRHAAGPGAKLPEPSLLRTHPTTVERVARLLDLAGTLERAPVWPSEAAQASAIAPVVQQPSRPRWHRTVAWY